MTIKTVCVNVTVVAPGSAIVWPLSAFTSFTREKKIDEAEWGICEADNGYWVGYNGTINGTPVLRASLSEIKQQRDDEYAGWEDQEIFVLAGRDERNLFRWMLLNKDEWQEALMRLGCDKPVTIN